MASPSELSLECKPHSFSMLLKSFGDQSDQQTQKLEDYLSRLEEERLKIDAFKRELPLCMQLLTHAVEVSKQQLQAYRANTGQKPVLEEFIPLKHANPDNSENKPPSNSDKANWMTSAQLWSQTNDAGKQQSTTLLTSPKETSDFGFNNVSPNLTLDTKQRNGGAFLPFSKERNSSIPDLALNSADNKDMEDRKCLETENGISRPRRDSNINPGSEQGKGSHNSSETQTTSNTTATTTTQPHRKARRCWSPDLHRRFVNALQMLGGSQVATPKQIRELMKVDGLTNDEVKSHLQKYRLHTRRPSPSPQAAGAAAPQLVVLGGIWVPPEYATAATHGGAPAIYSSGHYCAPPVPQEFYAAPPPSAVPHHQLHHHSLHHQQLQVYKGVNNMPPCLPESEMRVGGERSESIEDGKSESSSEDRKEVVRRREDGEESNGSEITLKF